MFVVEKVYKFEKKNCAIGKVRASEKVQTSEKQSPCFENVDNK